MAAVNLDKTILVNPTLSKTEYLYKIYDKIDKIQSTVNSIYYKLIHLKIILFKLVEDI